MGFMMTETMECRYGMHKLCNDKRIEEKCDCDCHVTLITNDLVKKNVHR